MKNLEKKARQNKKEYNFDAELIASNKNSGQGLNSKKLIPQE